MSEQRGVPILYLNAVFIPEDDLYLVSTSREEPTTHTFRDGLVLKLSGALEWAWRAGGEGEHQTDHIRLDTQERYQEWCLTSGDPFEPVVVDRLLAILPDTEIDTWRPLKEWSVNELEIGLACPGAFTPLQTKVAQYWLDKRRAEVPPATP